MPIFTISASNVTMPASGMVALPFTLTSSDGFVGSVGILCVGPTVAAGVRAPYCEDYGPAHAYTLTANGTTPGSYEIVAIPPKLVPAVSSMHEWRHGDAAWALAGVVMLGIGLRKRTRRWARLLAMCGIGVVAMSLSGCGGPPTLTPGTYVFTLNAQSVPDGTTLSIMASTTATVTVPPGILTSLTNSGN